MANELFGLLMRLTLASTAALLAVLFLRRPLRALFAAQLSYAVWLLVPAALLAASLPTLGVTQPSLVVLVPAQSMAELTAPLLRPSSPDWTGFLLAAWLLGAATLAALFGCAQRRYVRSLGCLSERDGLWHASTAQSGPALLGLFKPKIVVPADFALRYDDMEQALIVAHEKRHSRRADPLANAMAALLQCLFWFNPLIHLAAPRFRFDQELACDAAVMEGHPGRAQAYAGAMLKTQDGGASELAACHWQSSHPLKERIMNLNQGAPARSRRLFGRLLIASLLCATAAGAVLARADSSAAGANYDVKLELEVVLRDTSGVTRTVRMSPRLLVHQDKMFAVRNEQQGVNMVGEFWISDAGNESVSVRMKLKNNGKVVGAPSILSELGASSTVTIGAKTDAEAYKLVLTVERAQGDSPEV